MTTEARGEAPASLVTRLMVASRPLSWVNTAYPFAVAVLLSGGSIDARFIIGTLFFLVPYNLLMYGVNDVFDFASDQANPRKGGVEGAVLPARMHRVTLIAAIGLALPFVIALVLLGDPASWAVLVVLLVAVVGYSAPPLRTKEVPVLDSITSSVHFVGPAVYGLVLVGATFTVHTWLVLVAFFAWGMASHAFGAVQDVVPDREGGIASIATVLGAKTTVRAALAAWAIAGVLMLLLPLPASISAVFAVPYLALAWPHRNVTDAASGTANRGWRHFLWVNYLVGFGVTLVIIATVLTGRS